MTFYFCHNAMNMKRSQRKNVWMEKENDDDERKIESTCVCVYICNGSDEKRAKEMGFLMAL